MSCAIWSNREIVKEKQWTNSDLSHPQYCESFFLESVTVLISEESSIN